MYRKVSLIIMMSGVLFFGVALMAAFTGAPVVDAQADSGARFVGSEACIGCHFDIATQQSLHGHSYPLNRVNGAAPQYPHGMVLEPPEGYTWNDVSFVIGGFSWKARFIDQSGYIITGDENATTQYDFALVDERTGETISEARWSPYNAGQEAMPYTCGNCHTTGYNHNTGTTMYDALPGMRGQWVEEGVQCEECHGPGSLHITDPITTNMLVDRSAGACSYCHRRGEITTIDAADGFIQSHLQYEELIMTPHLALGCIGCHDPHQSSAYHDENINPNQGMRAVCTDCHLNRDSSHGDRGVTCVDCHMAPIVASGNSDPERHWGDINSHLFQINLDATAPQFSEDDSESMPYLTIESVCGRCHVGMDAGMLSGMAANIHK